MNKTDQKLALKKIGNSHLTTNAFDCLPYSGDILYLPNLVKRMMDPFPIAIARPTKVTQIAEIVEFCNSNRIPVIARGGGSSGLFASVPKKGGLVLETLDLKTIIDIDREQETVTVQAGITWWELEKNLNKKGLTLRSYPSSAPSATVGGWVMTSGLGIGSLKYGSVFDQIISLDIVDANGKIKEYNQNTGMEQFYESEGMLGIVTQLELKVRSIPEYIAHHLYSFNSIDCLFQAISIITQFENIPYSIEFFDGKYVSMLKNSGYTVKEVTPEGGILLVTLDGTERNVSRSELSLKTISNTSTELGRAEADAQWKERFNILKVRRSAPSMFPCSVYSPLQQLPTLYKQVNKRNKRIGGTVGFIVTKDQCNFMPMIVTNEKHPIEYMFSLHTPREVSNLAISLGGKPGGGVGVWNAPYRTNIFGKQRFSKFKDYKRIVDINNTFNPGSWLDPPVLFTPTVYQATMQVASLLDRVLPDDQKPKDSAGYQAELNNCVQCGYCVNFCPTKQDWLSATPRGRILAMRELLRIKSNTKFNLEIANQVYECTMCGRCGTGCSVDIQSREMWLGVRHHLNTLGLTPNSLKQVINTVDNHHNIAGRSNDLRANWVNRTKLPYDLKNKKKAPIVYFVGCVASFFPSAQSPARAFVQILNQAGIDFTIAAGEEWCCGFPTLVAGDKDVTRKTFQHNIDRIKDIGASTVLVTCPGCYKVWKNEYLNVVDERHHLTVLHSTEFLVNLIEHKKLDIKALNKRVTYHDPCDLGRNSKIYDEPRFIMNSIPDLELVELENNREYCSCCGSGGDLLAFRENLSLTVAGRKLKEIKETGVSTTVTACPSCIRAINMAKNTEEMNLDVLDITELIWKSINLS